MPNPPTPHITSTINAVITTPGHPNIPCTIHLTYTPTDPYAITHTINTHTDQATWLIGRDLLIEAITNSPYRTGDGDVTITVWHGRLFLDITSPHGHALITLNLTDINTFLQLTLRTVALGTETRHIDHDQLVGRLLYGEATS